MEPNNFKLFEIVNETIQDIYDFVLRYFKTIVLSIFRPKKVYELLAQENKFKTLIRPYNFILFSFVVLVLGIEFVKEPLQMEEQEDQIEYNETLQQNFINIENRREQKSDEDTEKAEPPESRQLLDQILELNTKSLISRFLPVLLLFILFSKMIEAALCKVFKKEIEFGYLFLYGIGTSSSIISIVLFLIYAWQKVEFQEINFLGDAFLGIAFASLFIVLFLIIFPAFLITRSLKYSEIKFINRSVVFILLLVFNVGISFGYISIIIPEPEYEEAYFTEDEDSEIKFGMISAIHSDSTLTLEIYQSNLDDYTFDQNSFVWIDAVNFYDEETAGLCLGSASFVVSGKYAAEDVFRLRSDYSYQLDIVIADPPALATFDSLFTAGNEFEIELLVQDRNGYERYAYISFDSSYLDEYGIYQNPME